MMTDGRMGPAGYTSTAPGRGATFSTATRLRLNSAKTPFDGKRGDDQATRPVYAAGAPGRYLHIPLVQRRHPRARCCEHRLLRHEDPRAYGLVDRAGISQSQPMATAQITMDLPQRLHSAGPAGAEPARRGAETSRLCDGTARAADSSWLCAWPSRRPCRAPLGCFRFSAPIVSPTPQVDPESGATGNT